MTTLVPVLLAGGSGTRLWPLSREAYPKQFLKLGGERTLLQETALRARRLNDSQPPIVICGDAHRFIVAEQLREIGIDDVTIVLEPEGRNTAPAAAVAALQVQSRYGDDALIFLMSADHAVRNVEAFCDAAGAAVRVASRGRLMVFGIRPTRPETGFGYLKRGRAMPDGAPDANAGEPQRGGGSEGAVAYELEKFVEKPDLDTARSFLEAGGYDWNGGLFLFPVGLFLQELRRFEPEMVAACADALRLAKRDLDFIRLDAKAFSRVRAESIDYALMEKTDKAALVPMDADWDDVGSWTYLGELATDDQGNYVSGDVLIQDSESSLIHSESRMVAALGLRDLVVVETKDAVLVAHRERVQDVKSIVSRLKAENRQEAELHPTVHRPWGSYESIASGPRFQVKRIVVKPERKLSSQMHHHRAEHWIVVRGTARVTCDGKEFLLSENESTYIPLGSVHRLENPGKVPLELIEVQSGSYLGEDDIVRFEDIYGRSAP